MKKLFILISILLFVHLSSVWAAPSIEAAFSPYGDAEEAVIKSIKEAKKTIRLAAYSFTSKNIARALIEAHKNGVDIMVVLDKSNATEKYSAATFLDNFKIPTRINYQYPIMHNKFIIIDGSTVETGSFNYSKNATKNAENILIIKDSPITAQKYLAEWQRLWSESEDY